MPDVTLTGDYHRLRDAIEDEINHHHIHLASGLCECGRFRGKDPAAIRAHAAEEILSALLRLQRGKDEVEVKRAPCGSVSPEITGLRAVPKGTPCMLGSGHLADHPPRDHRAEHEGEFVEWLDDEHFRLYRHPLLGVDPGRYRYRMDPKDLMEPPNSRQFIGIYDPPSTPVDIPVEDGDAEQECRDRDAVEQDLRARLADAESALARVRELAVWWQDEADKSIEGGFEQWASIQASVGDGILAAIAGHHLRAALDGKP